MAGLDEQRVKADRVRQPRRGDVELAVNGVENAEFVLWARVVWVTSSQGLQDLKGLRELSGATRLLSGGQPLGDAGLCCAPSSINQARLAQEAHPKHER